MSENFREMKTGLRLLLIFSLGMNVVGGIGLFLKSREAAPVRKKLAAIQQSAAEAPRAHDNSPDAAPALELITGPFRGDPADPRLRDLGYVKAALLSEGFPEEVVGKILQSLRYQMLGGYELEAIRPRTPEVQQKLQEMSAEIWPPGPFPGPDEIARYGDLSAETMRVVGKVLTDSASKSDAFFFAALKPILSPAQFAEYEKYNTLLARRVQEAVASLDIDEATYTTLWEAAVKREGSIAPTEKFKNYVHSPSGLQAIEDYRRVLGDEGFVRILYLLDQVSASADAVYQVAGLTPTARADLFTEAFRNMHAAFQANGRQPESTQAAVGLYQELVRKAGLTPEQVAGFDKMELGSTLKRGSFGQGEYTIHVAR
jgi:hypothetical protein